MQRDQRVKVTFEGTYDEPARGGEAHYVTTAHGTVWVPGIATIEPIADPEPPLKSVVMDNMGDAWQRFANGWACAGGPENYNWAALNKMYAPLKVVWTP